MYKRQIHIVIFILLSGILWSQEQEDGVVSFSLPVRNSLTFNKFLLSPTFSFVRESDKILSFTTKQQWTQFENAPVSYLFSYSGRLNDNSGFGVGLYQDNFGVLTTFGGVLNYVYNVQLAADQNLSFGANLAAYQSGINSGNVITNFPDPSLDNIPSNFLMTLNPSINYGTRFLDVGLTLTNYTLYNFTTSSLIEDDPLRSIDAHLMYTGYMNSSGFFDDSKFSTLVRSQFRESDVVLSGLVMLTVPKGIWGQLGYNTLNGFSVGLGLNAFKGLMIEYNYEKAMGDLSVLGSAHEITLAYKFKNRDSYKYTEDAEMASLIPEKRRKTVNKTDEATRARIAARAEARRQARLNGENASTATVAAVNSTNGQAVSKKEQDKDLEAKQIAKKIIDERAEAEALAKLKAKQQAEEEAKRLQKLKANEELRRKQAEEVLAAALAEEAQQKEEARVAAEREAAEKEAQALARAEAEAKRQAQLKAEEEKRREKALALQAAAEAEALRKEEEAKALAARQAAEEEARQLALKQAEEEKRRAEQLRLEEENRRKAAMAALAAAEAEEEKRQQEELMKAQMIKTDEYSESIQNLTDQSNVLKEQQDALIEDLKKTVEERKQDLADLKEENDLSEKGIYKAPKPFKSVSEENAKLEALNANLDKVIKEQDKRINELQELYKKRREKYPSDDDEVGMIYLDEIVILQSAQKRTKATKQALLLELGKIKAATEIERKRRIKRAAYDNQEDRYAKDMADLERIKATTTVGTVNANEQNFDFGDSSGGTIKILQDVKHTENGYYLVMAVHSDKAKRDEFLKSAIAAGAKDISFFYDVNTSKYYIYQNKFKNLNEANQAKSKLGSDGYDEQISMVKIENKSMK